MSDDASLVLALPPPEIYVSDTGEAWGAKNNPELAADHTPYWDRAAVEQLVQQNAALNAEIERLRRAVIAPLLTRVTRAETELHDLRNTTLPTLQECLKHRQEKVVELQRTIISIVRDGIINAPCPTPAQWKLAQIVVRPHLEAAEGAVSAGQPT